MAIIYLLYLTQSANIPTLTFGNNLKFPLLWVGSTESPNLDNVIYDKRSCYIKFKKYIRYYRDYMELFKYQDLNPEFKLNFVGRSKYPGP